MWTKEDLAKYTEADAVLRELVDRELTRLAGEVVAGAIDHDEGSRRSRALGCAQAAVAFHKADVAFAIAQRELEARGKNANGKISKTVD